MSNRPDSQSPRPQPSGSTDTSVNPDREYEDSTESRLDRSKPPHHDKTAAGKKHEDEPQISVGKP